MSPHKLLFQYDVMGVLYYDDENDIREGTKAKWTLDWVVFYRDKRDGTDFKSCVRIFPPAFQFVLKSGRVA